MKVAISKPKPRGNNDIGLVSGWNSSLTDKLSTKKKWINRGILLGTGSLLIVSGILFSFIGGMLHGLGEIGLGAGLIIVVWPVTEWVMRSKAHMGTSIDILDIEKWELHRLVGEYLRSRGYRYRHKQENMGILKGEGFELLDDSLRLMVFKVTPMHLSGSFPFKKKRSSTRLGIRNIDSGNLQTGIAIQIELDRIFAERRLKGSPPRTIPVIYRWNGQGYDTIV